MNDKAKQNGGNGNGNKPSNSKELEKLPKPAQVMSEQETMLQKRRELDQQDAQEGFSRVNPTDGPRIFYKPEPGAELRGILKGRFEKTGEQAVNADGEKNYYYQVELTRDYDFCVLEKDPYAAIVGDIINVDERHAMRDLAAHYQIAVEKGYQIEILIRSIGKRKARAGRQVWVLDIKGRIVGNKPAPLGANGPTKQLPANASA